MTSLYAHLAPLVSWFSGLPWQQVAVGVAMAFTLVALGWTVRELVDELLQPDTEREE